MCFYHGDAEVCELWEQTDGPAGQRCRCSDCNQWINEGEFRRWIEARKYAECRRYDDDDGHDCDDALTDADECDYGEEYDYYVCERCLEIRRAIREIENAEGCHGEEAEPLVGNLCDDVSGGEGWEHYRELFRRFGYWKAHEYSRVFDMWKGQITVLEDCCDEGGSSMSGTLDYTFGRWRDVHEFDDLGGEG